MPPVPPVLAGAIDLHAHFLPARYREAALAHGQGRPDGMPALPEWDAATAVAMMDDVGIAAALLSLSSPGVGFVPAGPDRAELCRRVNDDGAEAVARFPHRLGLLAGLPLPDLDAALAEIDRAFDELGADGIGLHTHYDDVYLGDPRLDPVLAALDRRGAVVTIHPVSPCGWEQVAFDRPRPLVEFLFDTTRAVINLALSGALDRFPSVRWVVPHSGAALAVVADRVERIAPVTRSDDSPDVAVVAALQRLRFDLAGVPLPRSLAALLGLVGPDRLVYGSDYPFTPAPLVAALARDLAETPLLDADGRDAALRGNAEQLFPRFTRIGA
ncbi:amidohydrolase family protein [Jatrophihabitans fulvus]